MSWSAEDLSAALEVQTSCAASGVSIDTRTLVPGDLYIALQGHDLDGHIFVQEALDKGAAAVVVSHSVVTNQADQAKEIIVEDTQQALIALGIFARKRYQGRVIAVTGSAGKTSTKEILSHIFSQYGPTVASPASFNNHWGVPLTLARIPLNTAFAIIEIGMNHPGEIAPLSQWVHPHAALITSIGEAHLGNMGNLQAIAEEKAAIFSGLTPSGVALFNTDHPFASLLNDRARDCGAFTRIAVGKSHLIGVSSRGEYTVQIEDQEVDFTLPTKADHMALNALLALHLVHYWRLDLSIACKALSTLPSLKGRGHLIQLPTGGILMDDAYNANPLSMRAGLSSAKELRGSHKIAILGEMLELGEQTIRLHEGLLPELEEAGIQKVYAVGTPGMKALFDALPENMKGEWTSTATEMQQRLPFIMDSFSSHYPDVIFVKGSKGSQVSTLITPLLDTLSSCLPKQR